MKKLTRILPILLCVCLLIPLAGCSDNELHEKQIFSMNTQMTLKAYGKHGEEGIDAAISMINMLNPLLDPENELSPVYDMNKAKGAGTAVKSQVVELLKKSKQMYDETNKAFNPAVYPIVKAWGFINSSYRVPKEEEITELLKFTDFSRLSIQDFPEKDSYMVKMPDGMQISFAAIAKGYASNLAVAELKSAGVKSAFVSLGGNIQTLGNKPDGSKWRIAIQDPQNTSTHLGVISVGETAIVTSGGYNRYFETPDGKRYIHIINPSSGMPVDNGLISVTIVCPDGAKADALSTALYVMGEKKAINYYKKVGGFEMILVNSDNEVIVSNGLYADFEENGNTYKYSYASTS